MVQINLNHIAFTGFTEFCRNQLTRFIIHLFNPDTIFIDLTFYITVSRTGNAQTDRTRSTVTRQADDADIVSHILTTKLCTQANLISFFQYLFFQFHIAESTPVFITGSRQLVIIVSRS